MPGVLRAVRRGPPGVLALGCVGRDKVRVPEAAALSCDCAADPHKVWCAARRAVRERRVAEAARPAPRRESAREQNARIAREYWAGRRGRKA